MSRLTPHFESWIALTLETRLIYRPFLFCKDHVEVELPNTPVTRDSLVTACKESKSQLCSKENKFRHVDSYAFFNSYVLITFSPQSF